MHPILRPNAHAVHSWSPWYTHDGSLYLMVGIGQRGVPSRNPVLVELVTCDDGSRDFLHAVLERDVTRS